MLSSLAKYTKLFAKVTCKIFSEQQNVRLSESRTEAIVVHQKQSKAKQNTTQDKTLNTDSLANNTFESL